MPQFPERAGQCVHSPDDRRVDVVSEFNTEGGFSAQENAGEGMGVRAPPTFCKMAHIFLTFASRDAPMGVNSNDLLLWADFKRQILKLAPMKMNRPRPREACPVSLVNVQTLYLDQKNRQAGNTNSRECRRLSRIAGALEWVSRNIDDSGMPDHKVLYGDETTVVAYWF